MKEKKKDFAPPSEMAQLMSGDFKKSFPWF